MRAGLRVSLLVRLCRLLVSPFSLFLGAEVSFGGFEGRVGDGVE